METLETLREQRQKLLAKLAKIDSKIRDYQAATVVKCGNRGCAQEHRVDELEYIQSHWYTEPHGCTGGDYFTPGEGRWKCPGCGTINRIWDNSITELKPLFKSVVDVYDR